MTTLLQHLHLAYLSKPAEERGVYRTLRRLRPRSIVELGVGTGERTRRMLKMALQLVEGKVHYTGADLFEARASDAAGLSLKEAHRLLSFDPRIVSRLVPGDVLSALTRTANSLANTDLLLISGGHDPHVLDAAWYYVPRMLHDHSVVLLQGPGGPQAPSPMTLVTRLEIEQLAAAASRPLRSAA